MEKINSSKGFSLLELMFAIAILSIAIGGIIAGLNSSIRLNQLSNQYSIALLSAKSKLEELQTKLKKGEISLESLAVGGYIEGDFDIKPNKNEDEEDILNFHPKEKYQHNTSVEIKNVGYWKIKKVKELTNKQVILAEIYVYVEWKGIDNNYHKIGLVGKSCIILSGG